MTFGELYFGKWALSQLIERQPTILLPVAHVYRHTHMHTHTHTHTRYRVKTAQNILRQEMGRDGDEACIFEGAMLTYRVQLGRVLV